MRQRPRQQRQGMRVLARLRYTSALREGAHELVRLAQAVRNEDLAQPPAVLLLLLQSPREALLADRAGA